MGLENRHEPWVHLDRIKWEGYRPDKLEDKPDYLFPAPTTFICLDANIIVQVKKLKWVLGLDEDHPVALLDVLHDLAEFDKFVKIIQSHFRGT